MKTSIHRFVITFKSGIETIQKFFHKHKKMIAVYVGKIVLFLVKTIIEVFLEDLF